MRTLTLLILSTLPALGADVSATVTVSDAYMAAVIAGVERGFLAEADTDEDGVVSEAEARAWLESRMAHVATVLVRRFVAEAESADEAALPQAYRDRLQALRDAEAARETEREKATTTPTRER